VGVLVRLFFITVTKYLTNFREEDFTLAMALEVSFHSSWLHDSGPVVRHPDGGIM
jgi:hypothetical protein